MTDSNGPQLLAGIEPLVGTPYFVLRDDTGAVPHIRRTGRLNWDPEFARVVGQAHISPGATVLDIGAFIGDTAEEFLQRGCVVHAFEPRLDSFVCLCLNCPAAHCYMIAIGDGTTFSYGTSGGSIGGTPLLEGGTISVPLDGIPFRRVDFLKIDVEGFEPLVLAGARETIVRFRPMIHIEINPGALRLREKKPDDVLGCLKELGYTDFRETFRYRDENWDLLCT